MCALCFSAALVDVHRLGVIHAAPGPGGGARIAGDVAGPGSPSGPSRTGNVVVAGVAGDRSGVDVVPVGVLRHADQPGWIGGRRRVGARLGTQHAHHALAVHAAFRAPLAPVRPLTVDLV